MIVCEGPSKLNGFFKSQGAKNCALPLIASSIVFDSIMKINNVPRINDVYMMCDIISSLGGKCEFVDNSVIIDPRSINSYEIDWALASKMRASFDLLGSLVYRFGKAIVPLPGGCLIGNRKVDMHLWIAKQLGFDVSLDSGNVIVKDFDSSKFNDEIHLWIPSVGATKNATFLGLFVSNNTSKSVKFYNIATEPEISYLWDFLIQQGFNIKYDLEKRILTIYPSKIITPSLVFVDNIDDRIEVGTYAIAASATKGSIIIENKFKGYYSLKNILSSLWSILKDIGIEVSFGEDYIYVKSPETISSFQVSTGFYPDFPTDLQPQMVSLALAANGVSIVYENIFDDRFVYVGELIRLGASINVVDNKKAIIEGGKSLKGTFVKSTDIRGGAAILIACLISQGKSFITNTYQMYRGYENIIEKLSSLGVNIYWKENVDSVTEVFR